jgi:OmpA-OmpF porin, OOP family
MTKATSILAGITIGCCLLIAPNVSAATLIGDYQFQGDRSSSTTGAAALSDLGSGSNAFQSDSVMGASRQVLAFPKGNGLQMSPVGFSANASYSVVMTFRMTDVSSYRRLLDFSNGTSDIGVYVRDGTLAYFALGTHQSGAVLANNTYATVGFVSDGSLMDSYLYANGAFVLDAATWSSITGGTLRFFKDAAAGTQDEESGGAVSCIRVYTGTLTAGEIASIGANPRCGAPAPTATPSLNAPKPKCKKQKKKHRAAEAKKKKCKKKRKS